MVLGKRHFPFLKRGDAATSCGTSRRSIYALLDPLRGRFNVENTASCRCASDRSRCPVIYDEFTDFARAVANMAPLAGLDLGTVTIGVAVSDTFQSVATPLETIKRKKFGVDASLTESGKAFRKDLACYVGHLTNFYATEFEALPTARALKYGGV